MADQDKKKDDLEADESGDAVVREEAELSVSSESGGLSGTSDTESPEEQGREGVTPAQLGATKYVQAAFFGAGIIAAYLVGKILGLVWSSLAQWPAAVRAVPQLLSYAEDERSTLTMTAGAVVALIGVVRAYRKEHVRRWADEVAAELSKVVWPDKETVTNGTIVVIIAGAIATVYIGLLDRFWGFVTNLVYGA